MTTLILDDVNESDTLPVNIIQNDSSVVEHEILLFPKISEEQLFYLMSRGLSEEAASEMIILGFLEPFTRSFP